jgi:hypothetical protein
VVRNIDQVVVGIGVTGVTATIAIGPRRLSLRTISIRPSPVRVNSHLVGPFRYGLEDLLHISFGTVKREISQYEMGV